MLDVFAGITYSIAQELRFRSDLFLEDLCKLLLHSSPAGEAKARARTVNAWRVLASAVDADDCDVGVSLPHGEPIQSRSGGVVMRHDVAADHATEHARVAAHDLVRVAALSVNWETRTDVEGRQSRSRAACWATQISLSSTNTVVLHGSTRCP